MTKLNATPATLVTVLKVAAGGEDILLTPGNYGDVVLRGRVFAPPIRLTAATTKSRPVLRSLVLQGCAGVTLDGLAMRFTPDPLTKDGTAVVFINKSKDVTILAGEVSSGPAVNGVPEDAQKLDSSGNILGWPTCHGVTVLGSENVVIRGVEIHHLFRGVNVGLSARVEIADNEIHNLRKSAVVGGCNDLTIKGNRMHSARPWRYGQTPAGDHGDWIAIWNGGPTRLANITITDNLMTTGEGVPMMGGWVQGKAAGIDNVVYARNAIIGGANMGFSLSDVHGGKIDDNVMVQDVPGAKSIGISISNGCTNISATGNLVGSIADKAKGATGNTITETLIVQRSSDVSAGRINTLKASALAKRRTAAEVYQEVLGTLRRAPAPNPNPAVVGTLTLDGKIYDVTLRA